MFFWKIYILCVCYQLKELKGAIVHDEAKGDVFEVTFTIEKSKTPIFAPYPAATPVGIVS